MPELYVVGSIYETLDGLHGTVTLPDGRVWILDRRRMAEAAPDRESTYRRMTIADVDVLLELGVIDLTCARNQVARVL